MMFFSIISSCFFFFFSYSCRFIPLKMSSSESSSSRSNNCRWYNIFSFLVSIISSSSMMLIVFSGRESKLYFTNFGLFICDLPSNPPIISMLGSLPAYSFFFIVSLTGDHESLEISSFPFCYLNIEISVSIRALTFEFFNSNSTIS